MFRYFLVFVFVGVVVWVRGGDDFSRQIIDTKSGLSQGMVYDILEDELGFIWFCTKNGLDRYDGSRFKNYAHDPFDPYSLPDGEVERVLNDRDGNLWVVTSKAVAYFHRESNRFHKLNLINNGKRDKKFTYMISMDEVGDVSIVNQEGVYQIKRQSIDQLKFGDGELHIDYSNAEVIYASIFDNALWAIIDYRQLGRWNVAQEKFEIVQSYDENTISIDYSDNGWLWVSTVSRDYVQCKGQWYEIDLYPGRGWIASSYLNVEDLSSERGIVYFIGDNKSYEIEYGDDPSQIQVINTFAIPENQYIASVHRDRLGNTWLGSNGYGAVLFSKRNISFKNHLQGWSTSSITLDHDGQLIVEVYHRFKKVNLATGAVTDFQKEVPFTLEGNLSAIIPTDRKHYWALYSKVRGWEDAAFLVRYNGHGTVLDTINMGKVFDAFTQDEWGHYWLVDTNGDYIELDLAQGTYIKHPSSGHDLIDVQHNPVHFIQYDSYNNCLWKGTANGLWQLRLSPKGDILSEQKFVNDASNPRSLSGNNVKSLLNDPKWPNRYIWVGTVGGGLNRMDLETGYCEHFNHKNGWPDDVIYGILAGSQNDIWCSTNKGLVQLNTQTGQFNHFMQEDGLPTDEFNTYSYFKHPDTGELIFGSIDGITVFSPKEYQLIDTEFLTYITSVWINNLPMQEVLTDKYRAPELLNQLTLNWNQNNISFQFSALSFNRPRQLQYRYRMVGRDKNWMVSGPWDIATYTNLPPGKYTFQVQGGNGTGQWSPYTDQLILIVQPPWWRAGWAGVSYLLLFVSIAWSVYRARAKRLRLKREMEAKALEAQQLKEINQLKSDFFNDVTYKLKTPLQLIHEPLLQALNRPERFWKENVRLAAKNTERLINITNQLIELARANDRYNEPQWSALDVPQWVAQTTEEARLLTLQYSLDLYVEVDIAYTHYWLDVQKLTQIVRNLINNAVKFTPKGGSVFLAVMHEPKADQMVITVRDTGIGIPESQLPFIFNRFYKVDNQSTGDQSLGIGLAVAMQLTQIIKGTLKVESQPDQGSTFTLCLPVNSTSGIAHEPPSGQRVQFNQVIPARPVAATSSEAALPDNINFGSKVVLVVEDHVELRKFVADVLSIHFQVVVAENGHEGVQVAKRIQPDLILSDALMPILDGYQFCQTIKSDPTTAHIPFLLMTAKIGVESELQALQHGADGYIQKPFNTEVLRHKIENLLRQSILAQRHQVVDAAEDPTVSPEDQFVNDLHRIIRKNLHDQSFTTEVLAQKMGYSRSQLHRKIKAHFHQSSTIVIRNVRLQEAKQLIETTTLPITDIAYQVGFTTPNYFSSKFKEYYGISPITARQQAQS